jgi:hypothetical protein
VRYNAGGGVTAAASTRASMMRSCFVNNDDEERDDGRNNATAGNKGGRNDCNGGTQNQLRIILPASRHDLRRIIKKKLVLVELPAGFVRCFVWLFVFGCV